MEHRFGWTLDKRISLGHLVMTVTLLVTMVLWGAGLETLVVVVEETLNRQSLVDDRQDNHMRELREEIREALRELNAKLDRYFEHHLGTRV
ncbi:MAG: hypothetical protein ACE5FN_11420 [Leptospirillia bacterium]